MRREMLPVNEYSRPGTKLRGPIGIVLHWVGNPGTSAEFNRRFFADRADGRTGFGSAHYIIDATETIQCIPDDEVAYHAGPSAATNPEVRDALGGWYPNECTIGIELCHIDWAGRFSDAVLSAAVTLVAELSILHDISPANIYRHFDCTTKDCPRWFVDNVQDWHWFRNRVWQEIARA